MKKELLSLTGIVEIDADNDLLIDKVVVGKPFMTLYNELKKYEGEKVCLKIIK